MVTGSRVLKKGRKLMILQAHDSSMVWQNEQLLVYTVNNKSRKRLS